MKKSELINNKPLEVHITSFCKVQDTIQHLEEATNSEFVNIDFSRALESILDYHENCIRKICGMPKEDDLGTFVFDRFYNMLLNLADKKTDLNNVIQTFLAWKPSS